jgi:hypothetical protein
LIKWPIPNQPIKDNKEEEVLEEVVEAVETVVEEVAEEEVEVAEEEPLMEQRKEEEEMNLKLGFQSPNWDVSSKRSSSRN